MIRQLKQFNAARLRLAGGADFAVPDSGRRSTWHRECAVALGNAFPARPDATAISETIPLFYVVQNKNGFWLAREANGRTGGLFLLRRSAAHFAAANSNGAGCATMFLAEPFELDVPNNGGRIAALLDAAVDELGRRAPTPAMFVRRVAGRWRRLIAGVVRALASERKHRRAIERELFGGQFVLTSKCDDDLPVIR